MAKAKVRVGVIGTGNMANTVHLPSLAEMDDVQVVALCDLVAARVNETAERFGVGSTYLSYHDMLADEKLERVRSDQRHIAGDDHQVPVEALDVLPAAHDRMARALLILLFHPFHFGIVAA